MFCMPCTILLMVSPNHPIFGCQAQDLHHYWLIRKVHQACLVSLDHYSARKNWAFPWGICSCHRFCMGPPPYGLRFIETYYQSSSPSDTEMFHNSTQAKISTCSTGYWCSVFWNCSKFMFAYSNPLTSLIKKALVFL